MIESAHLQHPLDRPPLASQPKLAILSGSYRDNFEIKLRRGSPIDAKLVQAGRAPLFQRGEVEKRVFDRAFDLVGMVSRQENDGSVGLDALDGCRNRGIGFGRPMKFRTLVCRASCRTVPQNPQYALSGCPLALGRQKGKHMSPLLAIIGKVPLVGAWAEMRAAVEEIPLQVRF